MATKTKSPAAPAKKKGVTLADDPEKELADDDPEKALSDEPDGDQKDKEIASLKTKLSELEQKLADAAQNHISRKAAHRALGQCRL